MSAYKIFCDESCHLQNDGWNTMTLGALMCKADDYETIKNEIKAIKSTHKNTYEIKWTKVSKSRLSLYKELIDYFFEKPIRFRSVTVINKSNLDHHLYNQTHSDFYYKTFYLTLKFLMTQNDEYKIYFDTKDTRGKIALNKTAEVFENSKELSTPIMQHIRAHESQLLQMTDLFIGAVSYRMRDLAASDVKNEIIAHIESRLGRRLDMTMPKNQIKFNIFIQDPKKSS